LRVYVFPDDTKFEQVRQVITDDSMAMENGGRRSGMLIRIKKLEIDRAASRATDMRNEFVRLMITR